MLSGPFRIIVDRRQGVITRLCLNNQARDNFYFAIKSNKIVHL
jgi:hypothetical protein